MDRLFINGEKYRVENADSGLVTTFNVENDRLVLVGAEDESGKALQLSPEQAADAETSAAAMIKAGELRPLHDDER